MNSCQIEIAKMNVTIRNAEKPLPEMLQVFLWITADKQELLTRKQDIEKPTLQPNLHEILSILHTHNYHVFRYLETIRLIDENGTALHRMKYEWLSIKHSIYLNIAIYQKATKCIHLLSL